MTDINTQLPLVDVSSTTRFKGNYAFCGVTSHIDNTGLPYWQVSVCDFEHEITLHTRYLPTNFNQTKPFSIIQIEARNRISDGLQYHIADYIMGNEIPLTPNIYMLPYKAAIFPKDVFRLVKLVETIHNPLLQAFIAQVLLQPSVTVSFLRNPASQSHHHSFLGGLLRHSVEVAELALSKVQTNKEADIVITVALLHDIGKVKTLSENLALTKTGSLIEHDDLTLEICASALSFLHEKDSETANILRHCWTFASPNARYGFKPKYHVAKIIQESDYQNSRLV